MKSLKILLIGYLPPPTGGVRVLFRQLTEELNEENGVRLTVINLTGRRRGFIQKTLALSRGLLKALYHCFKVDVVSLQPTNLALVAVGPPILLACRILKKPLVIRKFGGSFHEAFDNYPSLVRALLQATVFKASLWLLETHFLVNHFKHKIRNVAYYPNSRPVKAIALRESSRAVKFVFVSHISSGKGVKELFEVSDRLPSPCQIDVFGPLGFDISKQHIHDLSKLHRADYKGELSPGHVMEVLKTYDVLLLPTCMRSEGYPGIILEAYSCGLPVIASNIGAIGEIVDSSCGVLVEPGDLDQLERAIVDIHLRQDLFQTLRLGAAQKARQFDSRRWTKEFLHYCKELYETGTIN